VRVARLPVVPELGDGALLAVRHEDRVVAESLLAARRLGDPAFEDARPAQLLAVRAEQDELADVARPTVLGAAQLAEQPFDRLGALRRVAGRADPRRAAERLDLEPGVLAEDPAARREPVGGLGPRVLVVAVAALLRIVVRVERLDLPGQERRELPQLVPVPRRED
jgi:hypothetical protein